MSRATDAAPACWNCGKPLTDLLLPASRHEYCPHCAEPVHCCRMCALFAPTRADQCLEDRAEHPTDKTAANFCDFFTLREREEGPAAGTGDAARSRLDALFGAAGEADGDRGAAGQGTPPGAAGADDRNARARGRLDELFGGGEDGG